MIEKPKRQESLQKFKQLNSGKVKDKNKNLKTKHLETERIKEKDDPLKDIIQGATVYQELEGKHTTITAQKTGTKKV